MAGFMATSLSEDLGGELPAVEIMHPEDGPDDRTPFPDLTFVPWPEGRPRARVELLDWAREHWIRLRYDYTGYTWLDWLKSFVPFVGVMQQYKPKEYLVGDVIAGLTVGAMLVPQSLSYAKLAGLPSVFGLYGGFIPIMMYALFGSSRQLGVGPVAVTSLLLGSGLPSVIDSPVQSNPNNPADPLAQLEYNEAAIQVAFLAGLMYTGAGVLGLGWVTNFLSHSVISGFMTGAAIIIGLSQVKYIFGYDTRPGPTPGSTISFPRADPMQEQLSNLFSQDWLPYFKWREFTMGMCWIVVIIGARKLGEKHWMLRYLSYFASLAVVIASTALVYGFGWYTAPASIKVVGSIPAGLPGPTVSWFFPMPNFGKKILLAFIVCLIDMLESISIARALALKHGYELQATAELRGLGLANIIGSCFNCYTTTGSFSRSSVQSATGANTQLAGLISSLVIMIVLLVATPLFHELPLNAMAAIIIAALPPLFNYKEFLFLWRVNKFDCLVFSAAFLGTVFLGVELGLAISIGVSLVIVVFYAAFPQISVIGHLRGTSVYPSVTMYPEAREVEGILILRVHAPMFFANINPVASQIEYLQRRAKSSGRDIRFLVLDLSAVPHIDGPAVHFLKGLVYEQSKKGVQVVLVQPAKPVITILLRSGLDELVGRDFIGMNMHEVIQHCLKSDNAQAETTDCAA